MSIFTRKPKGASADVKAFVEAMKAAMPEQCKHGEQGFCARCAKEASEPPMVQGCEHGWKRVTASDVRSQKESNRISLDR